MAQLSLERLPPACTVIPSEELKDLLRRFETTADQSGLHYKGQIRRRQTDYEANPAYTSRHVVQVTSMLSSSFAES